MGENELFINECYNPAVGAVEAYEVKFSFEFAVLLREDMSALM